MIAIIPARSGSKRIKNKNIKLFNNIPIIGRVIQKLKACKKIKKIVVTSDSKKILKISKEFGSDILIKRPKYLANDYSPFQASIVHALKKLKKKLNLNKILVVFPCSVFIKNPNINKALKMLNTNKKNFLISICRYSHPVQRAYKLNKKNKLIFLFKKNELKRTQDLGKTFYDAGQFYLGFYETWMKKKIHSHAVGIEIDNNKVVDIDYPKDWYHAEKIFKLDRI